MTKNEILKILKEQKNTLQQKYQIDTIGVFGSFARDKSGPVSDIDIVVKLKKQDLFELIGIKQELEERFHSHVDLVSYRNTMNPYLKKKIDQEAIYV